MKEEMKELADGEVDKEKEVVVDGPVNSNAIKQENEGLLRLLREVSEGVEEVKRVES